MKQDLNKKLKERLIERRFSIPMLSKNTGINETTLRNYMARNKFSKTILERICSVLGLDIQSVEEEYNFGYVNERRSEAITIHKEVVAPFSTMQEARDHTLTLMYRTALGVLDKTYYKQSAEGRQNIVNALEKLLEEYSLEK